jgi:ketosteroid isomerase-like protein
VAGDREQDAVRRYYAAWSAGDLDAMLALAHPDIQAAPTLGLLYDQSLYAGHDGIRAWFAEVDRGWQAFEPRVLDVVDQGDVVIAFIRLTAWRDGRDFDASIAVLHTFRDGRIATLTGRDWFEVREELGLDE